MLVLGVIVISNKPSRPFERASYLLGECYLIPMKVSLATEPNFSGDL